MYLENGRSNGVCIEQWLTVTAIGNFRGKYEGWYVVAKCRKLCKAELNVIYSEDYRHYRYDE